MLSVPRHKAYKEYTAFQSRANMTLTVVQLERTLDIALIIFLHRYPEEIVDLHTSSDMWNYLRSSGVERHRTLVQVVKEELQAKYLSQDFKCIVNVCSSRSAYVSGIENPIGAHLT